MAFSTYQFEFAGGDRTEKVKTIEFLNSASIPNVFRVKFFKEEGLSGTFAKKEYRYSFDNAVWTNWNTLTQQNLIAIQTRDNPNFYIHFRYTREGIGSASIQRFYLFYESDTIPQNAPAADQIDADLLGGQPPAYYLNRENHFGPYTDLDVQNVLGTGAGTYNSRQDSSNGTVLYFSRIAGGSGVSVSESSAGIITLDASGAASGVYDSSFDPSASMVNTIGGIPAGTTVAQLEGKTFSDLWDELLFPTAYPNLTPPSIPLFNKDINSLQEVASIHNINFTTNFSRGSISPQYTAASPYRSGFPNSYSYTGSGIAGAVASSALSNIRTATNYVVIQGNQTWGSAVAFDAGVQPFDSKGNPYQTPLLSGSTAFSTTSVEGVYPLFATTSNINTLTKQSLVSMISSNNVQFNLVSESGGNKQKFEIPVSWLGSRPLIGVETFNTFSNQWEYQGGNSAASLTFWTTSGSIETIQGNNINYTRYTYNSVDRGNIQIRLKF